MQTFLSKKKKSNLANQCTQQLLNTTYKEFRETIYKTAF